MAIPTTDNKTCVKCNTSKPISEFEKNAKSHRSKCRQCRREESRNNYWKKPEEKKAYATKYRNENKEYFNEYNKKYYIDNIESESERKKKHYHENKEYYAEKHIEYMNRDGVYEKEKERWARYREDNKEAITIKKKLYMRGQAKLNTDYVKRSRIRSLIGSSLKNHKKIKSERSEQLLGCSVSFAVIYLESLGYNRIEHDVDHIVPLANFNINNISHRKVAFNYRNMQPLPISENRSKQAKLEINWELKIEEICNHLNLDSYGIINYIKNNLEKSA